MNKKILFIALVLLVLFSVNQSLAQYEQLKGVKICLDPGHGGHDGDDRQMEIGVGKYFYESDGNWDAVGYLDTLLQKLGAEVKVTKTTNHPDSVNRQPSLSDRVQVANNFGADLFLSYHTNGSSSVSTNYTLMIYAVDHIAPHDPWFTEAVDLAGIMADEMHANLRTTHAVVTGDIPFSGFTYGYGILNNLLMPGVLSEASFHSNLDEARRLINTSYRKSAAWALVKSYLEYFGYERTVLGKGELGGIITDASTGEKINGLTVTINPGQANEQVYNGDYFLNGFYFFDWLEPGSYTVNFEALGYSPETRSIDVTAGNYTETDLTLTAVTPGPQPAPPVLTSVLNPDGGLGISATWLENTETDLLGYRLYYARDDSMTEWVLAADEKTLTGKEVSVNIPSSYDFLAIPDDEDAYHFRLTAVTASGAESEPSDVYSRTSHLVGDKILIVDGFDRVSGAYTQVQHDFASSYCNAIREAKLAEVATASNEAITNGTINLSDYQLVIWFVGDESTAGETFTDQEQILISAYLDAGGKMVVSGTDIGFDLANGSASDQAFYQDYLKATYIGNGAAGYSPATGLVATDFDGLVNEFGIHYTVDSPDDIAAAGGSELIFNYAQAGTHGGVAYLGTFGTGTTPGGMVYMSYPLETTSSADRLATMKVILSYLNVGDFFPDPPNMPTLRWIESDGDGVYAEWAAPSDPARLYGYRLYYAGDDNLDKWYLVADEQTLNAATTSVELDTYDQFLEVPSAAIHHYKLVAVNEGGFESESSDVYSCWGGTSNLRALLVDGFDRTSGSYSNPQHHFAANYAQALYPTGDFSLASADNARLLAGDINLEDYDMIFWFFGDESSTTTTLALSDQSKLKSYLENGGKLFITGSEIGWDLVQNGSTSDKDFYQNYLKASFQGDGGAGRSPATGVAGTDFSDLVIEFGITYVEDWPDEISARDGSENILRYANGKYGGVAYTGTFGTGVIPGAIVHISFTLETANQDDINATMAKVVDYFGVLIPTAPVATDDTGTATLNIETTIDVLANDYDINNDLNASTLAIVDQPIYGTATISNNQVLYTQNQGADGIESFTYKVADLAGQWSDIATVTLDVSSPPNAVNDTITYDYVYDQTTMSIEIDVLANDWDDDDDIDLTSITIVNNPSLGTASVSDNKILYVLNDRAKGEDSFTYKIADATGLLSDEATVFLTIDYVVGIEDGLSSSNYKLYPNPGSDMVFLVIEDKNIAGNQLTISVLDYSGKMVDQVKRNLNGSDIALDINNYRAGIYYVIIQDQVSAQTLKLIKK